MARSPNQKIILLGWKDRHPQADDDPGFTGKSVDVPMADGGRIGVEWPEHPGMEVDVWGAAYGRHTNSGRYEA